MIDPKQPPPGWRKSTIFTDPDGQPAACHGCDMAVSIAVAHSLYAEHSRPAVIDFAERITSWLESFHGPQSDVIHEIAGIILAAARGERALP